MEGPKAVAPSDAGVMRSFPHPDPAEGQEGHHFTPATSFDFLVRVPKDFVTESKLRRIQIPVYRIKEGPFPQTEGPEPLAERYEGQLRGVGRLRGVDIKKLPKPAQARARHALR